METNTARLLSEQNDLLREQTDLLRRLVSSTNMQRKGIQSHDDREIFVENIDHDEMRDGFLVTSQRKKLWNVQINLINEFARVCKKHNLRWFAGYGTLLGAARHKGFIPWDDDVDVIMFRPDYEKFKLVAAKEIRYPYFLDVWYNYRAESEGASLTDNEGDFQFITKEQQQRLDSRISHMPMIKLRDSRTSMIAYFDRNCMNQGIWIDIFPLDPVPPFTQQSQALNFAVEKILFVATVFPQKIKEALQNNVKFPIDINELKKFLSLPYRERGKIFDNFMRAKFFMGEQFNHFHHMYYFPQAKPYKGKCFSDVTYLPFEKIEVPAPADYESVLQSDYGDWRKPVFTSTHAQLYSTEISWREYFQKTIIK